jgi:hypothetical protein
VHSRGLGGAAAITLVGGRVALEERVDSGATRTMGFLDASRGLSLSEWLDLRKKVRKSMTSEPMQDPLADPLLTPANMTHGLPIVLSTVNVANRPFAGLSDHRDPPGGDMNAGHRWRPGPWAIAGPLAASTIN